MIFQESSKTRTPRSDNFGGIPQRSQQSKQTLFVSHIVLTEHLYRAEDSNASQCDIRLEGNADDEVSVLVTCGQQTIGPKKFDYKAHAEMAPDTQQYGFRLFASVSGIQYAVVVNPGTSLIIGSLEVRGLSHLGALFLVENAQLVVENGVISKVYNASIAAVMNARGSTVQISNLECTKTSGKQAGVLISEKSDIELVNSVFKDNIGDEKALLFGVYDHSTLNIVDSVLSGPLPHSDIELNQKQLLSRQAFNLDPQADAGVAYVSGASVLNVTKSLMEDFPSGKGMIYLEENSKMHCKDSELVNNFALYGGAIHARDSHIQLHNVRALKNTASRGGALLLHGSSSCELTDVLFQKNMAIEGGSLFVEGHQDKGALLSLRGCNFEGNKATSMGGALYSENLSLDFQNCNFTDNSAEDQGGAIYALSPAMTQLTKVKFVGNAAKHGGAVAIQAEHVHSNVSLHDASFLKNKASDGDGGAVFFRGLDSTFNVSASLLEFNTASKNGGGVSLMHTVSVFVVNSTFNDNSARFGSGGSLYVSNNTDLLLTQTKFRNSKAGRYGGEVHVMDSQTVSVKSVGMSNSTAGLDGGGLALRLVGTLSIMESTVEGCSASQAGGGVSFKEPLKLPENTSLSVPRVHLADTQVLENAAEEGGGLYVVSIEYLSLEGCHFTNNNAGNGGGIFAAALSSLTLSSIEAVGNSAAINGGFLHASNISSVQLSSGSHLLDNQAGLFGGACHLHRIPWILISRATFRHNDVRSGNGGALGIDGVRTLAISDETTFHDNKAQRSGGAIFTNEPEQTEISNTQFVSNTAVQGNGGALYFLGTLETVSAHFSRTLFEEREDSITFTNVTLHSNKAGQDGGALYLSHLSGELLMEKTSFEECKAVNGRGGCAYLSDVAKVDIPRGHFETNAAGRHGGCLFVKNVPLVHLDKATFSECTSSGKGGAVYLSGSEAVSTVMLARDGELRSNKAEDGGAYYIRQVDRAWMDESFFFQNHAVNGSGGGMDIANVSALSLMHLTMNENNALLSCGGICLTSVRDVQLSGNFTANKAATHDGGVSVMDRLGMVVIGGEFKNNQAARFGGAIHLINCDEAEVTKRTLFAWNKADAASGGALNVQLVRKLSILDTNFTQNAATSGGGVALVAQDSSTASIVRINACFFGGNKASRNGGGLVVVEKDTANAVDNQTTSVRAEINQTLFENNRARNGGGVALLAGKGHFHGSNFTNNDARRRGGGLFFNTHLFIVINDSLIERNTAHKGGAMAISCHTKVNFTYGLVSHNAAHRRDDGGLYTCDAHFVFIANVTFVHNFRDFDWYFYIIFSVGGYGMLFIFLGMSYYVFKKWNKIRKQTSIVVHSYSDIGEPDPEAFDLSRFLSNAAVENVMEDEPVVAPKPLPETSDVQHYQGDMDRSPLHKHSEIGEIEEGLIEDWPSQPRSYSNHVQRIS